MLRCFLAMMATVLSLAGSDKALAQGGPAGVTTDFVGTMEVAETVSVFGQVVTGRQSNVATRVMGVVETAPLRVGDTVRAGDVVFQLDTERLQIELEQAQAEIGIAEAGLVVAEARADRIRKALERTQTLVNNATVSQAQLDDRSGEYAEALGSLQQAQARITAARAGLRAAEYNVENSVVRAPFDGTVLDVTAEVGEFVNAGHVVVLLLDQGALEVEANVPSRYTAALQSDQPVMARTDAGGDLELALRAILPTEFSSTRTRPVRFTLTEGVENIAVGQSVTLDVPVSRPEEVVVVPKDAVTQAAGGWQVFVHAEGKAIPRPVEIGRSIGGAFEVVNGLAVGDEVVVRGNERLRPGQDIAPTPVGGPGGTAAAGAPGGASASGG
ncbi:MAG: efflux RND transporter periplasmic adaptor subunit [Pseudomonadota bacterium]